MNLIPAKRTAHGVELAGNTALALNLPAMAAPGGAELTVGVRASALHERQRDGDMALLSARWSWPEISGSDTFVHVETSVGELVAQLTGVHIFTLGQPITLYLHPGQAYVFDAQGDLLVAPEARVSSTGSGNTTDMARIDLDLAHAYKPNPQRDEDYALLPLKMSFVDGGAYALLGPSGCGKTTMLNIISGLVKPSHGTVKFDGKDVTRADTTAAQHCAGVPVPCHLRHHDGGAEPGLPAEKPRRLARAHQAAGAARSPRCWR